ncbi:6-bladed beta-propeller [candidate division KSB1 bacterium]
MRSKKIIAIILLLLTALLFSCSGTETAENAEETKVIENALTFEMSFGADELILPDEYLLSRPQTFDVDEDGNFIVFDEDKVKVYDKDGEPKTSFGRQGQGPGEFGSVQSLSVNKEGYLTVVNDVSGYNLYDPDYKYIDSKNYRSDPECSELIKNYSFNFMVREIFSLNADQRVFHFDSFKDVENNVNRVVADGLIFEDNGTFREIVLYYPEYSDNLQSIGGGSNWSILILPNQAKILWDILPDNKIIYTNPAFDKQEIKGISSVVLHILDLETFEFSQIIHEYTPVEIKESLNTGNYTESSEERIKRTSENLKYFNPLHELLTDDNFIFLVPLKFYMFGFKIDVKKDFPIEVIDAETGKQLCTANFPFIPSIIKNGYAYRRNRDPEGFSIIERYRIDPKVYGK